MLSSAALELSSVGGDKHRAMPTPPLIEEVSLKQCKPWQQVIEERLKAKTRLISKVGHIPQSLNRKRPLECSAEWAPAIRLVNW